MRIKVNGQITEIPVPFSVSNLFDFLKVVPERVAVEVNLNIVDRKMIDQVFLNEGDTVEIIGFVGGGT